MKADAIWALASVVFGFALGLLASVYRVRHDFWLLADLGRSQLASTERQLAQQLEADERRRLIERRGNAYKTLSRWMTDLERTVDDVWRLAPSVEEADRQRVRSVLDSWVWETLRVPAYAAWGDLYWSDEVRSEIRRFKSTSVDFITAVQMRMAEERSEHQRAKITAVDSQLWKAYGDLQEVIAGVRSQAHKDLTASIRDPFAS